MLRYISLSIFTFLFSASLTAQTNGILPFTGIKYFRGGIWGKAIEVKLNGDTWMSNRLPLNYDFEIRLVEPRGLKQVGGKYFPGIKVLMLDAKKDTIAFAANLFEENKGIGLDEAYLKSLKVSLGFTENDKVKPGDTCYQYITFFDTKGNNDLRLEFPVIIAKTTDSLQTTVTTYTSSSTTGYNAMAGGGIELKKIETYIDSTYYPKSLYHNLRSAEMLGITIEEVNNGKFQTWVYDEKMNELPFIKPSKQFVAKTFTDKEQINILAQVPLNPDDKKNRQYTVRYRWESVDGKKVLDIINNFMY
ncbi:hypothetical protein ACQ33O_05755 [Ferruginibacter sp. SUN002]|uniref:hypothetical protein n=1 Tax=Ferruginibacter sp. SUN002 TaxID=2937789 RepID=UPI003D35B83C